jgi:hypothetical protein
LDATLPVPAHVVQGSVEAVSAAEVLAVLAPAALELVAASDCVVAGTLLVVAGLCVLAVVLSAVVDGVDDDVDVVAAPWLLASGTPLVWLVQVVVVAVVFCGLGEFLVRMTVLVGVVVLITVVAATVVACWLVVWVVAAGVVAA